MGRLLKSVTGVAEGGAERPAEAEAEVKAPAAISAPADDAGHPAHRAKHAVAEIDGRATEILVQPFDDSVLVTVTQNGRMGTMLSAQVDTVVGGMDSFTVTVLMGKRDEQLLELLARRVLGKMTEAGCRKRLLMSVALQRHSFYDLQPLVDAVLANKVW